MRNERRHERDEDRKRERVAQQDEERNGRSAGSRQYGEYQGEEYRDEGLSRDYGEDVERAGSDGGERDRERERTAPSSEERASPDLEWR